MGRYRQRPSNNRFPTRVRPADSGGFKVNAVGNIVPDLYYMASKKGLSVTKVEYRYIIVWYQGTRKWGWSVYRDDGSYEHLTRYGVSVFRWLAIRRAKNVIVQAGLAAKEAKEKERLNVDKTVVIDV